MLIKGARDEQDEIRISRPYSRQCKKARPLFPCVVTERRVNFDLLRIMLGDEVYGHEAYEFTWPGKRDAIREVGRPSRSTLRPWHLGEPQLGRDEKPLQRGRQSRGAETPPRELPRQGEFVK